jgi:hypothetical protein
MACKVRIWSATPAAIAAWGISGASAVSGFWAIVLPLFFIDCPPAISFAPSFASSFAS